LGGLSKSAVSSRFVEGSRERLKALQERDLSPLDFVAMFVDGKYFAEDEMVTALGVQPCGKKTVLGFVQTGTENESVVSAFLRSLLDRGLDIEDGILCVIDGAKGLRGGIKSAFGTQALVQRCQWHKRENVVSYLPKNEQAWMRKRLQRAYERPTYKEAKAALTAILKELKSKNQSAESSLEEGLEETLTLHKLGVFAKLGRSFKTTNCVENLNSLAGQRCDHVSRWKNSDHKQRWLASILMELEPKLRRVAGYQHLPALREALRLEVTPTQNRVVNR
jgi:transposase-like protein